MKNLFSAIIFLLMASGSQAQNFNDSTYFEKGETPPIHLIKLDLFSPLYRFTTITVAYEYKIKPDLYLQHELGFITNLEGINPKLFSTEKYKDHTGLLFRSELRYYIFLKKKPQKDYYLASGLTVGRIKYPIKNFIGVNCINDNCDFYRYAEYNMYETIFGGYLKVGTQKVYKRKFIFDLYLGTGYKSRKFIIKNNSLDEIDGINERDMKEEDVTKFNFMAGLRIGIVIK